MAKLTPKQYQTKKIAQSQKNMAARKSSDAAKANGPTWTQAGKDTINRYPLYNQPQQQNADYINQIIQQHLGKLNLPGNPQNSFQPIRQNALAQFQQYGAPSIAERFNALGGQGTQGGALSSPQLYQQLSEGEHQVRNNLNALESQYNLQNSGEQSGNLLNLLRFGLSPQSDYDVTPGQPSKSRQLYDQIGGRAINTVTGAAGGYFMGGPAGAVAGGIAGALGNPGGGYGNSGFTDINNPYAPRQ